MNQILQTTKNKNKLLKILKFQIILSVIGIFCVFSFFESAQEEISNTDFFSKTLAMQTELNSIYNTQKTTSTSNILGRIEIPTINLKYIVFNSFSEEQLKISPCKFYGPEINKTGNIAIAGHNFDNHTFFSDLNKLKIEDKIYLYSLDNFQYVYSVYKIYETSENDLSVLNSNFVNSKELTLVTCNNSNKKRFIIKAIMQI